MRMLNIGDREKDEGRDLGKLGRGVRTRGNGGQSVYEGRDRQWRVDCVRGSDVVLHVWSLDKQDPQRACLQKQPMRSYGHMQPRLLTVRNCEIVFCKHGLGLCYV